MEGGDVDVVRVVAAPGEVAQLGDGGGKWVNVAEHLVAQSEIAALTRRFEDVTERTDREFGIVKSDLTALRLQAGNLDQKVSNLGMKVTGLAQTIERNQAQIIDLLPQMVGRKPDTG